MRRPRRRAALMIQGTGSHVGKSLIATALCRVLAQDGVRVRPFKAQNMSNNAFVTRAGGEIARAQAEQARACGVEPTAVMNPVLLKPTTDVGAQVVLLGQAVGTMSARAYHAMQPQVERTIREALRALREDAEVLVIEGAGSPAEINLRAYDRANMWVAREAGAAVLLVGDIDHGGVFAQFVGTLALLDRHERNLVRGFIINKFRGDAGLLAPGLRWLERRTGRPVLGTVPWLPQVDLASEDTLPTAGTRRPGAGRLQVAVVQFPRISNFTDVDPLSREPDVQVDYLTEPTMDPPPDCVILPGSKSTIADLAFLRAQGFEAYLDRCARAGGEIVGLCGGFQMLGSRIEDPERLEATVESAPGLGWLPMVTRFQRDKVVTQARGVHLESGCPVVGYEIHMGRLRPGQDQPGVILMTERNGAATQALDGWRSRDGRVWGTYLHGVFDEGDFRRWWVNRLRRRRGWESLSAGTGVGSDGVYDRLAEVLRAHLDLGRVYHLLGMS